MSVLRWVLNANLLFDKMFFISVNAVLAMAILAFMSLSLLPSDVIKDPRYLNVSTWFSVSSPSVILHLGISDFFDTTITSVFFLFSDSPSFSLSALIVFTNFWRFASLFDISTVSSAYLRLLMFCPPINIPGSPWMVLIMFTL